MLTALPSRIRAGPWSATTWVLLVALIALIGTLLVGGGPRWPLALLAAGALGLGSLPAARLWRGGKTITGGQTWGWGAARAALILGALLSASFAQKAWRLAAPDTGWRSTVAFIGDDRPLFVEMLAAGQNAGLRPGDQLVGVDGHLIPVTPEGWLDTARLNAWRAAVGTLREGQKVIL